MDDKSAELPHPVYAPVLLDFIHQSVQPVLIGGAAVVLLGGRKVTPDLDISFPQLDIAISILYKNDFQVIATWNYDKDSGEMDAATFESPESAGRSIRQEKRRAFRAIHAKTGFILDVWLELHIPHNDLLDAATRIKIEGYDVPVASIDHLIELKKRALEEITDPEKRRKHEDDIRTLMEMKRPRGRSETAKGSAKKPSGKPSKKKPPYEEGRG